MRPGLALLALAVLPGAGVGQQANALNPAVYRVTARDCPVGGVVVQTGFLATVSDELGLVTALHGVVGCGRVAAENGTDDAQNLTLRFVDMARDAAFFAGSFEPSEPPLRMGSFDPSVSELRTYGYPRAVTRQTDEPLTPRTEPLVPLSDVAGSGPLVAALETRNSPSLDETVLVLRGRLQPGYSGAPILQSGRVVGIANGGLGDGSGDLNWAILTARLSWHTAGDAREALGVLASDANRALFNVQQTEPSPLIDSWRYVTGPYLLFTCLGQSGCRLRQPNEVASFPMVPRPHSFVSGWNGLLVIFIRTGPQEILDQWMAGDPRPVELYLTFRDDGSGLLRFDAAGSDSARRLATVVDIVYRYEGRTLSIATPDDDEWLEVEVSGLPSDVMALRYVGPVPDFPSSQVITATFERSR